jgi:hypothetical protein
VAETVALCWQWFRRCFERGKDPMAFPSALAAYAARAVRSGRRLAGGKVKEEALSEVNQARRGYAVERLPEAEYLSANPVSLALADNTQSPPDEQVAFRPDFGAFRGALDDRRRRLLDDMAAGWGTGELVEAFGLTPGRVSQLRREFEAAWKQFTAA